MRLNCHNLILQHSYFSFYLPSFICHSLSLFSDMRRVQSLVKFCWIKVYSFGHISSSISLSFNVVHSDFSLSYYSLSLVFGFLACLDLLVKSFLLIVLCMPLRFPSHSWIVASKLKHDSVLPALYFICHSPNLTIDHRIFPLSAICARSSASMNPLVSLSA